MRVRYKSGEDLLTQFEEGSVGVSDWKTAPEDVLEQVDLLLAEHGLEIVVYNPGESDDAIYQIVKRRK